MHLIPYELVDITGLVVGRFSALGDGAAWMVCRNRARRGELEVGTGCRRSGEDFFFWVLEG